MFGATVSTPLPLLLEVYTATATVRAKVSTALPLLLGVPRAIVEFMYLLIIILKNPSLWQHSE